MPEQDVCPSADEQVKPVVTRRDFIAGAGLGVAATAIVAGGVTVATRQNTATAPQVVQTAPGGPAVAVPPAAAPATAPQQQAQPQAQAPAQQPAQVGALPRHMRRVTLNIDGVSREVVVDVRESLWTTATQKLGLNVTNLGWTCAASSSSQGHRRCATSLTRRSLASCSSYVRLLPMPAELKPHCGLMASRSSGTCCSAPWTRFVRASVASRAPRFVVSSPSTTVVLGRTWRSGANSHARSVSYSSKSVSMLRR